MDRCKKTAFLLQNAWGIEETQFDQSFTVCKELHYNYPIYDREMFMPIIEREGIEVLKKHASGLKVDGMEPRDEYVEDLLSKLRNYYPQNELLIGKKINNFG